jgi:hypothetical protein
MSDRPAARRNRDEAPARPFMNWMRIAEELIVTTTLFLEP